MRKKEKSKKRKKKAKKREKTQCVGDSTLLCNCSFFDSFITFSLFLSSNISYLYMSLPFFLPQNHPSSFLTFIFKTLLLSLL